MASKSKKRRRVLGASCILAALIIAGSSFAWFTSKDEVTNRLTASADYGVSIIENFVPPKQFVPGQTVKKEEAVTNTGNVDAFVKQTISADMKVSVEVPTIEAPTAATAVSNNYLELDTQSKFGTIEAGSTLAWAPEASSYKPGIIIDYGIDGNPDKTNNDNHDFEPNATGLYIFRRAIVKNSPTDTDTTYEYVGYYYVADGVNKYYKLYAIGAPTIEAGTDGLLSEAPNVSYSRKIETTIEKVDMTFLAPGDNLKEGDNTTAITDYRLKVQYSTDEIVNGEIANQAKQANAEEVYTNYQQYLDYLQGKTTYVPAANGNFTGETTNRQGYLRALNSNNSTGLTEYDKYDQDDTEASTHAVPAENLSNFSYKRLEDLKYGENYTVANYGNWDKDGSRTAATSPTAAEAAVYGLEGLYNNFSPVMNDYSGKTYGAFTPYDGSATGEVDHRTVDTVAGAWTAAQKEADRSRQIINTGVNAAVDLAKYKKDVEDVIGRVSDDAAAKNGLRLVRTAPTSPDKVGTNVWVANMIYSETADASGNHTSITAPDVQFKTTGSSTTDFMEFDKTSEGDVDDALTRTMTADNVREARFKDVGKLGIFGVNGQNGSQVLFNEVTNPYDSSVGVSTTLKTKWDAYVQQVKRKMLIDKKIELVESCIQDNTGVALPTPSTTETNVVRSVDEAKEVLKALKAEQTLIYADYTEAKKEYDAEATKVANNIKKMNELQAMVDAANKEYNDYIGDSNHAAYTYTFSAANAASEDPVITNVLKGDGDDNTHGQADSPVEDKLEDCLKKAYGVAHMADAPAVEYHVDHKDSTGTSDTTDVTARKTYSLATTKSDIDAATTKNNDGTTTFTLPASDTQFVTGDDTKVKGAPYYRLNEVDNMMAYRKTQYEGYKSAFDTASANAALFNGGAGSTDGVVLYIGLSDDVVTGTPNANDKWQYVGNASKDKSAKEFDFGYTSILGAGETSSQLIKYVKFDNSVEQGDFLDLVFDINAGVESAQVVYNGTRANSEAARDSLSPIVPGDEEYASDESLITWALRTNDATAITETDPDPKVSAVETTPAP